MELTQWEQERLDNARKEFEETSKYNMILSIICLVVGFLVTIFTMAVIGGAFMLPLSILFAFWKGFLWIIQ